MHRSVFSVVTPVFNGERFLREAIEHRLHCGGSAKRLVSVRQTRARSPSFPLGNPLGASMLPTTSVLTCVYNDGEFLPESVESILSQDCADFEFMIVDDGVN